MIFCTTIFVSDFRIKFRFLFRLGVFYLRFSFRAISYFTFLVLLSLWCSICFLLMQKYFSRRSKMYLLEDQSPCQQQKPGQFPTKPIAWKDTKILCLESQRPTNALCKCQDQAAYKPSQSSLAVRIIIETQGGLEEPNKMEGRPTFLSTTMRVRNVTCTTSVFNINQSKSGAKQKSVLKVRIQYCFTEKRRCWGRPIYILTIWYLYIFIDILTGFKPDTIFCLKVAIFSSHSLPLFHDDFHWARNSDVWNVFFNPGINA